ncbi:MAG: 7-cyano-7-deazaguanine synthase QueC [Candidatus Synoicihabitans palmerolidicus]|nr:7-cyano-7-deazaguanine synthase QueC [Candidatus Synoicihabitans palmerolidicus]
MKVVVLCSGGMDSVATLYMAREHHEVTAVVSFDYGAKHNAREIPLAAEHAKALGVQHEIIALPFVDRLFASDLLCSGGAIPEGHYEAETMKQTVMPFRHAIMLSIACGWAESVGAEGLVIAAHGGDHAIYPDCREGFMQAMAEAMRLGTYAEVTLLRPFITMDKAGIAREGVRLGVDFGRTWSCYKGGARHCGKCGTCVERQEAFNLAGVEDPQPLMPVEAEVWATGESWRWRQLGCTWALVGLIWVVQLVIYPMLAKVASTGWIAWHREYMRRIGWVVAPLMLGEISAGAVWLWVAPEAGWAWVGAGLIAVIWVSTALVQVPLHRRLGDGFEAKLVSRLVTSNWVRTAAWTLRGGLLVALTTGLIP